VSTRVAVIGGGHLGKIHAKLVQQIPDVEFVGVAEPIQDARTQIESQLNVPTFDSWEKVVRDIDAAIVATPTETHHEIASALAAQGIHVLIEKPVTNTPEQAQHLMHLSLATGCKIQVGHVERFNAAFDAGRQLVGNAKLIQATRASGYTFRSIDVGVVLDLMIHDIDLVCQFTIGDLVDVQALGYSVFGRYEDMANVRLQFSDGLVANLNASRCNPSAIRQFDVFGTGGFAQMNLAESKVSYVEPPQWIADRQFDLDSVSDEQKQQIRDCLFTDIMPVKTVEVEPVNAILCEQTNWINAIRNDETIEVGISDAKRSLEIAQAILAKIDSHAWSGANDESSQTGPLAVASTANSTAKKRTA